MSICGWGTKKIDGVEWDRNNLLVLLPLSAELSSIRTECFRASAIVKL